MKEIIFRGQTKDKKWVYGYYINHYRIIGKRSEKLFNVNPKTICEFTGLKDQNGILIFEGDIVTFQRFEPTAKKYGEKKTGEMFWNNEEAMWQIFPIPNPMQENICFGWVIQYSYMEVIGNKYDNPELLKYNKKGRYEPINFMFSVGQENKMNKKEFQARCLYDHFNNELSGMIKRHEKEITELLKNLRDKTEELEK